GLPGSVRPEQPEHLARFDVEVDGLHRLDPSRIRLGELPRLDGWWHVVAPFRLRRELRRGRTARRDTLTPCHVPLGCAVHYGGRETTGDAMERDDPAFAAAWRDHRRYVLDVAYRMLGTVTDAEDVVQEAFARLLRRDPGQIEDVRGWLV